MEVNQSEKEVPKLKHLGNGSGIRVYESPTCPGILLVSENYDGSGLVVRLCDIWREHLMRKYETEKFLKERDARSEIRYLLEKFDDKSFGNRTKRAMKKILRMK